MRLHYYYSLSCAYRLLLLLLLLNRQVCGSSCRCWFLPRKYAWRITVAKHLHSWFTLRIYSQRNLPRRQFTRHQNRVIREGNLFPSPPRQNIYYWLNVWSKKNAISFINHTQYFTLFFIFFLFSTFLYIVQFLLILKKGGIVNFSVFYLVFWQKTFRYRKWTFTHSPYK